MQTNYFEFMEFFCAMFMTMTHTGRWFFNSKQSLSLSHLASIIRFLRYAVETLVRTFLCDEADEKEEEYEMRTNRFK